MIQYSDYKGRQDNAIVRDGEVVPFDREAAREMAEHAHHLAAASMRPTTDLIGTANSPRDRADLTAA